MADPQKVFVELPDGRRGAIPRASLEAAVARGARIVQDEPQQPTQQPMQASMSGEAAPGVFSNALEATGKFMRSAGDVVNPAPVLDALSGSGQFRGKNPLQAVGQMGNSMLEAQGDQLTKARDAWGQGNYTDALRYGMGYLIPMLGPGINHAGDLIAQGKVAEGLGETAGLGLSVMAPAKMQQAGNVSVRPLIRPALNQAEAAAIAFADASGIPVDLAMRSGSRVARATQGVLDNVLGSGQIAQRAKKAQATALAKTGARMADEVYPQSIVPQQAGETVTGALEAEVLNRNTAASQAYDIVRQAEADPANERQVQVGQGRSADAAMNLDGFSQSLAGKPFAKLTPEEQKQIISTVQSTGLDVGLAPVMKTVPLPVDLRNAKAQLKPTHESLIRQMAVAQQRASTGMKSISNIMDAPEYLPLSLADADLSAIKSAARGADLPELRTLSQGLAARAVQALENAVQEAAEAAGPEVAAARNIGRAETTAKYRVGDVLRQLPKEPVQVYQKLTYAGDSGVKFLRQVASEVPSEMPKVARAYLQGLLEEATKSGEFAGSKSVMKRWQELGPETKRLLYKNPKMVEDMDSFFRLAEMQSRNPNPSGSGYIASLSGQGAVALTDPINAAKVLLVPAVLAKIMYSPRAAKALTTAMRVPVHNRTAATMAFQGLMAEIAKLDRDQEPERKVQ